MLDIMLLTPQTKFDLLIDAMDWNRLRVKYISESSRNWREGCMCHWINAGPLAVSNILTMVKKIVLRS
jgi:hypothetical protein